MTNIPGGMFQNIRTLETVKLPKTLTKIDGYAFAGDTSLKNVEFTSDTDGSYKIKEIGERAFQDCIDLEVLDLPDSIETIYYRAFYNSGIKNGIIPAGLKTCAGEIYRECKNLETAEIREGCKALGNNIFEETKL